VGKTCARCVGVVSSRQSQVREFFGAELSPRYELKSERNPLEGCKGVVCDRANIHVAILRVVKEWMLKRRSCNHLQSGAA